MSQNIPYLARRARFLLRMTQGQFAEMFAVDPGTVSRWERGKALPAPEKLNRIRDINLSVVVMGTTKASPMMKYVARRCDLKRPVVVSKGVRQAILRLGVSEADLPGHIEQVLPVTPEEQGCLHALELIQQDPLWINRRAIFVETHCLSASFGWVDAMIIPANPEFALLEFVTAYHQDGPCGLRFVRPEDLD
jgi:transcriptional regulator with XRE-family HTH domain